MGKKNSPLFRTILIAMTIGLLSYAVTQTLNQEINPELPITLDASKIGQIIVEVLANIVQTLINPERQSIVDL